MFAKLSIKKVKVYRYVSNKRPNYAATINLDEESEVEDFLKKRIQKNYNDIVADIIVHSHTKSRDDPRLRKLIHQQREISTEVRSKRHRHIHDPKLIDIKPKRMRERRRI